MSAVFKHGKWWVEYKDTLTGPFTTEAQAQAWIDAVDCAAIGISGHAYTLHVQSAIMRLKGEERP